MRSRIPLPCLVTSFALVGHSFRHLKDAVHFEERVVFEDRANIGEWAMHFLTWQLPGSTSPTSRLSRSTIA